MRWLLDAIVLLIGMAMMPFLAIVLWGAVSTLPVEGRVAREQIEILEREVANLERHNRQLREAVDALLQPASSELLEKNMACHLSRMKR